ncbi:MAG TPA: hypothetical protein DEQ09_00695 [Bacteroidales bacterium]|nr:hypothetical protein [Bacteroidales bacterium]
MTIDNSKTIIRLRIRLFIATVIMLMYVFLVYFGKQLKFPIWGIEEFYATITLITLYLLLTFLPLLSRYKYIYFSDDGQDIIFRYYSVGFLRRKKSSIEIPKKEFLGYKMKKHFPGMVKSIQLYRLMGNKKASYTPVYLTALTKSERNKIVVALNKYVKGY